MLNYRLFFMSDEGRFHGVHDIDEENDDAAIIMATKHWRHSSMELWCGARMVREWPCDAIGHPAHPQHYLVFDSETDK